MNEEQNNPQIKGEYSDFIGIYRNALTEEFCESVIDAFDHYHRTNAVYCENQQFHTTIAGRFDWALDLSHMSASINGMVERDLNDVLLECFHEYVHTYGHLKSSNYYTTCQKVQKTPAGGGYHVWHDENTTLAHASRKVVWMFYLNDNFDGGETEFLYYHRRIKPETGTLLLWPAGLTHAHRGGLVLEGTKYVITGWFHVTDNE